MTHTTHRLTRLIVLAGLMMQPFSLFGEDPRPTRGVRTDFGDVMIENLGIGRAYNLRELAGKPLKVTNQGIDAINLLIDVHSPKESEILPGRLEIGFRPVPSVDWVNLSQTQFVVPPGESAYTDVVINVPDDPAFYGKKYQVSIYSRSVGRGFLHLGVWSHLFLTIVPSPEAQAELEKNRRAGFVGSMDYTLLPDKLVIRNAPLGRKLDIANEIKRTIKLANSGNDPIDLRLKVIPVGDTPIGLQDGYQEAKDLNWLTMSSDVFTVEPDTFVDPGLILDLPNDPALAKQKIMFVIRVMPADPDVVGLTYYGKIYVETQ